MFTKQSKTSAMLGFFSFSKSNCDLIELRKSLVAFFKLKIIFPN